MTSHISPKFTTATFGASPSLDQKIEVFEDRELGWRFNVAEAMEAIYGAGYAIIAVVFSYFEMFEQYAAGQTSKAGSKVAFRDGYRRIYPSSTLLDAQIDSVYDRVRCGMYHNGYTKFGTMISGDYPEAVTVDSGTVKINPHRLLDDLQTHFGGYIATLKEAANTAERANFEKTFDAGTTV